MFIGILLLVIILAFFMWLSINIRAAVGNEWYRIHKDKSLSAAVLAAISGILIAGFCVLLSNITVGSVGILSWIVIYTESLLTTFCIFAICLTAGDETECWYYYYY